MEERKKRQRPSKAEKQVKRVQRPQRVEPESRFDDLLKELRTPAPRPLPPATVPIKNAPTTDEGDKGAGVVQLKRERLDAAEKPGKKLSGKSSDKNYCRITLYMKREIHRRLKTKATALDYELSEVIERLVVEWLAIDNDIDDPFLKHFSVPRSQD